MSWKAMAVQIPGMYLGVSCKILSDAAFGIDSLVAYLLAERCTSNNASNATECGDKSRGVRALARASDVVHAVCENCGNVGESTEQCQEARCIAQGVVGSESLHKLASAGIPLCD
jgi:hypothetical protein